MESLSIEDFMRSSFDDTKEKTSKTKKLTKTSDNKKKKGKSGLKDKKLKSKRSSKIADHKKGLAQLEQNDPEFYKFLKEQDAHLLDFDLTSDESVQDDSEYIHEPPDKLEVASDDEEYESASSEGEDGEGEEEEKGQKVGGNVTLKMVKQWSDSFKTSPSFALVREIVQAFRGAVAKSGADIESAVYHVPDSTVFNAIIRLCFTDFLTCLRRLFDIDELDASRAKDVKKKAKWVKYKPDLKIYLKDIIVLLAQLQESELVCTVIKQIQQLVPFYFAFPKLTKHALKSLITIWSRKDETCRVAALVCIIKIMQKSDEYFTVGIKTLYMAYVNNSKLVTQETWPALNFMQRCFAEVVSLNADLTYEYAFVYIRQMAIHLRNAMTANRKDLLRVVYNWQYIMCLYLWCRALAALNTHHLMSQLIHPLTQIIFACARLIPSAKYLPLRYHCVRALLTLMEHTDLFCPVMGLITESLTDQLPFLNKKRVKQSAKPYMLDCVLKVSKSQLLENAYPDAVIGSAVELILASAHVHVNSIAFPEMIVSARERVRNFCKQCKIGNYSRQVRALFEKLTEHAAYIDAKRKEWHINLAVETSVTDFEAHLKENQEQSPLGKYFVYWKRLHDQEMLKKIYKKDEIVDLDVRKVPREDQKIRMQRLEERKKAGVNKSFEQIMQESDNSDDDMESRFNPNKKTHGQTKPALKFEYSDDEGSDSDQSEQGADSSDQSRDASPPPKKVKTKKISKKTKKEAAEMVEVMAKGAEDDVVTELDLDHFDF